jgi:signal transduction protein with GAF and PtsI domain
MVFSAVHGEHASELKWKHVDLDSGVAGWVARTRRPAVVNNAPLDERFYEGVDSFTGFSTHSLLAVPVMNGPRLLGVLELVKTRDGGMFRNQQVGMVNLCAHFLALLLARISGDARDADRGQ